MEPSIIQEESSFSFWKGLIFASLFFFVTPIALATSLFSLASLSKAEKPENLILETDFNLISAPKSGAKVFASLPSSFPAVSGVVSASDARPELIRQYLASYNSPLEPYAEYLVETADLYDLDYRLLTGIAQQESNLCKKIPPLSYNCWGWGIHSTGSLGFDSFEEGIAVVSQGIKENYIDKGYTTIEDIMSKYTPLSKGSWAFGVNKFIGDIY
ncbi:hypothetical protein KKH23_00870 [Patescibacteria group bacterium]|nr:hypothetical protein [Patescibacteria group bacterium]MBU0777045.1 hypothetical protein [Patescibacteria group bacterium]MBU0845739.1 hypothetical protein [Patescibacteria group bacterium]MBU0923211.1 hypothetical protein [Patescibacteria group bacterium]MBU1066501.1 hypothetical protein [Patescibacteria group bacterium]